MDTAKKKRLSKFNFEYDGAAVALVGDFQGGPANGVTTLITKATEDITSGDLEKALGETPKDFSSSVQDGENVVSKTEDDTISKTKEDDSEMTEQVTETNLEEQIEKAAEAIVAKRLEALEKSYEEKLQEQSKEVELLKARETAREKQEYLAKAEEFAKYLGEEADKEAIAKAIQSVEQSEDAKPVLDILKSLKGMVEQTDDKLFEEVGKSTTQDQPTDMETKVEALQKSLMKDEGLSEHAAYVRAFDEVRAESK